MLLSNGRANFRTPGRLAGAQFNDLGGWSKGGFRNRDTGLSQAFSAYPNGYLAPKAFILPLKDGAISSFTLAAGIIEGSATLIPARNLEGTGTLAISVTNAQLDQIVSLVASGTMTISVADAQLAGAANMDASSTMAITVADALCGAIFSVTASSSCSITGTGSTLTALAFMEAEAGGPTELSPEGLAAAVWNTVLADYNETGSTGEALANASSAGNPWDALLADNNDSGTFGERVQKLLTTGKFLGLK
jgi:hypothetical protein